MFANIITMTTQNNNASNCNKFFCSTYTEREEPRVYISPAPNWFCHPPAHISEGDLQAAIEEYNLELAAEGLPGVNAIATVAGDGAARGEIEVTSWLPRFF